MTTRDLTADVPGWLAAVRARTPARILVGRAGPAYRTATQLDAAPGPRRRPATPSTRSSTWTATLGRVRRAVSACSWCKRRRRSKAEYLMRPDLRPAARATRRRPR